MGRANGPNIGRGYRRLASAATGGAVVAVALLMALSPAVGALKPHVIVAPYKNTILSESKSLSTGGNCKYAGLVNSNHWIPKTGNVTSFVYASAKGCVAAPTGNGYADAYASDDFQVAFPVKVYTNTGHNFSVAFSYDYTLIMSVTGSIGCPPAKPTPGHYSYSYCDFSASAGSSVSMELYDATNHTFLYGAYDYANLPNNYTYAYNYTYCSATGTCSSYNFSSHCGQYAGFQNCAASGTVATGANATWINTAANCGYYYGGHCYGWQNWTLNSTHKYYVLAFVDAYADAYLSNYGVGHAALTNVNGATLGNTGWKITSVTVT